MESSRTISTIQYAVISFIAGREGCGGSVKREIKSEGTRGGISTGPKWSRLAEVAEKQSRYTTYNNGTNICCRKAAFVIACTHSTRGKQMSCLCVTSLIAAWGGRAFASCVFIARPGNNNRLLFITPAPNTRTLRSPAPRRDSFFAETHTTRSVCNNLQRGALKCKYFFRKLLTSYLQLIRKSIERMMI